MPKYRPTAPSAPRTPRIPAHPHGTGVPGCLPCLEILARRQATLVAQRTQSTARLMRQGVTR